MRRTILAGIIAATVGVPAAALAKVAVGVQTNGTVPSQQLNSQQLLRDRVISSQNGPGGSIGAGMEAGNGTGHVTGPGNSPVDNSIHAPINDLQPGHGTTDTRQNANPKPVY